MVETFEYQGVTVEVYESADGESYWSLVHFPKRIPGTSSYTRIQDAKNGAMDMIRGYVAALYDGRDFLSRNFPGLLSDMMEISHEK